MALSCRLRLKRSQALNILLVSLVLLLVYQIKRRSNNCESAAHPPWLSTADLSNTSEHLRTPSPQDLDLDFEWTIFITPQDFIDEADARQRTAIRSWLRLTPRPHVVLVGRGEGYDRVAQDYGFKVEPRLDMNFVFMPLAGSLVNVAMNWPTPICVILNSDIILTQSFTNAIAKIRRSRSFRKYWLFTGARHDIASLPDRMHPESQAFNDTEFTEFVRNTGVLHTAGGLDYFVWNNGERLIKGHIPPFIRGKSRFDNWLIHEAIRGGYRDIIDGTEAVVAVHVVHKYTFIPGSTKPTKENEQVSYWQVAKRSNWMIYHNSNLALSYGTFRTQQGTSLHVPWKLFNCLEDAVHGMCLLKRVRPGVCNCELSSSAMFTQTDPGPLKDTKIFNKLKRKNPTMNISNIVTCGLQVYEVKEDFPIFGALADGSNATTYGVPFYLDDLLPLVARNHTVIVTGGTFDFRFMLMNFVCNLRRLGLRQTVLVAAFDMQTYEYCFQMGLGVFYFRPNITELGNATGFNYSSSQFRGIAKLKAQVMLRILTFGYHAVWSDADTVWLQDPMPLLAAQKSDFVVQSDLPWPAAKEDNGSPFSINSGFYRVRSTPATIAAMQTIVEQARRSALEEHVSFFMVLCGGKTGKFRSGPKLCLYTAKGAAGAQPLEVAFLDRQQFANGASWDKSASSVTNSSLTSMVVLHNNWVNSLAAKTRRQIKRGFWWFNAREEICDYTNSNPGL